jgi:two-component system response regulator FixJ
MAEAPPMQHHFEALTPREREVLDLIVYGNSNQEVAVILNISARTVEFHRKRIIRRIGARNTADLARIWGERHARGQW